MENFQQQVMALNISSDKCIDIFTVGCIMHATAQTKRLRVQLDEVKPNPSVF
jgi:hypothetical protein